MESLSKQEDNLELAALDRLQNLVEWLENNRDRYGYRENKALMVLKDMLSSEHVATKHSMDFIHRFSRRALDRDEEVTSICILRFSDYDWPGIPWSIAVLSEEKYESLLKDYSIVPYGYFSNVANDSVIKKIATITTKPVADIDISFRDDNGEVVL